MTHRLTNELRDDDALTAYEKNVEKTKKFAVLGKNQVVKFISRNQVKRISLAGNNIENIDIVEKLASHAKNNILELSIAYVSSSSLRLD